MASFHWGVAITAAPFCFFRREQRLMQARPVSLIHVHNVFFADHHVTRDIVACHAVAEAQQHATTHLYAPSSALNEISPLASTHRFMGPFFYPSEFIHSCPSVSCSGLFAARCRASGRTKTAAATA